MSTAPGPRSGAGASAQADRRHSSLRLPATARHPPRHGQQIPNPCPLGIAPGGAWLQGAEEPAELCAHLPLALRIAAANLAAGPAQSLTGMVAELGGADLLARLQVAGDPASAVAAAFDLSHHSLSAEAQRLFRLLVVIPGPEASDAS